MASDFTAPISSAGKFLLTTCFLMCVGPGLGSTTGVLLELDLEPYSPFVLELATLHSAPKRGLIAQILFYACSRSFVQHPSGPTSSSTGRVFVIASSIHGVQRKLLLERSTGSSKWFVTCHIKIIHANLHDVHDSFIVVLTVPVDVATS
ncbi:hypothetical protein C8R45DRAFT_1090704 [Mycena sanguinolenta]|nr:hypothetical protein C8R45DRAFT_1090704 [Mycena sanguinolenta]